MELQNGYASCFFIWLLNLALIMPLEEQNIATFSFVCESWLLTSHQINYILRNVPIIYLFFNLQLCCKAHALFVSDYNMFFLNFAVFVVLLLFCFSIMQCGKVNFYENYLFWLKLNLYSIYHKQYHSTKWLKVKNYQSNLSLHLWNRRYEVGLFNSNTKAQHFSLL